MFFRMVYKSGQIFLPFCQGSRVWRTDGQTEFSSQYRVCITCSAIKMQRLYSEYSGKLLTENTVGYMLYNQYNRRYVTF